MGITVELWGKRPKGASPARMIGYVALFIIGDIFMLMKDFRKSRNMPFVKRGMRVIHTYNGKKGRISGANSSANLNITFDGDNYSQNCHPHWMMQYFDKTETMIAEYKD